MRIRNQVDTAYIANVHDSEKWVRKIQEDSRFARMFWENLTYFSVRGYCADWHLAFHIWLNFRFFIFIMTVKIIFCISILCNIMGDNSCEEELIYIFYHLKFINGIYKKVHTCSKITYSLCRKRLFIFCRTGSINICIL